jgi:hypothetical protein
MSNRGELDGSLREKMVVGGDAGYWMLVFANAEPDAGNWT